MKTKEKKIVILDNYDSFTYNLVHIIREITGHDPDVYRNDEVEIEQLHPFTHILLSPGPGLPDEAGITKAVIQSLGNSKIILGVCLGLQAIGECYGATLKNLTKVYHGKKTLILKKDEEDPILRDIGQSFFAGRYHSWVIDRDSLCADLIVTCQDEEGEIMGIRHKNYPIYGVQFHPESIMTEHGKQMIENFVNLTL